MSAELFNRRVRVQIGKRGAKAGIDVTDLRVKFRVEQTGEAAPNKAKVEVYNMTRSRRQLVEKPGNYIILSAGYDNTIARIYEGDIARALTRMEESDYITEAECGDGLEQFQTANLDTAFKPGTPVKEVFKSLAAAFGLKEGAVKGIGDESFLQGLSLSGPIRNHLDGLTARLGLKWSIQDGALQVLPAGGSVSGRATVLSSDTGLIGSPKRKDKGLEIVSLLQPDIRPGRLVKLEGKFLKGIFVCDKVIHEGDTHEKEFYSKIELTDI